MFPEMKSHGKGNRIKMKLCKNTRAIHHHHHDFVCRKQITPILIEILFYLHLNYLCACWLFILRGKNTICDAKTRVCVFCEFLIYYSKCGVRPWFYKPSWGLSNGLSLIQFTWDLLARAELSIGLPLLMRSGGKIWEWWEGCHPLGDGFKTKQWYFIN